MTSEPAAFKLSFDAICLAASLDEIKPWLGATVQKITPLGDKRFALGLYKGAEAWIMVNFDARHPRIHLMARRPQPVGEISEFILTLRKKLTDSKLVLVRQRGFDRIAEFGFLGEEGAFQLVAELTGRHATVILVDEKAKVVAADKFVGAAQSKRPVLPGKPYEAPPGESRPPLYKASAESDWGDFEGASPSLIKACRAHISREEVIERLKTRRWEPVLLHGQGAYPLPLKGGSPRASYGLAAEIWFADLEDQEKLSQAKSSLLKQLQRVLLARESALRDIREALEMGAKAPQLQAEGDLILAYQAMIRPGSTEVVVWDFEGNELTLSLNPELTIIENAQKRFDKAKKAKARLDETFDQSSRIESEVLDINSMILKVEESDRFEDVAQLHGEAESRRWLHKGGAPLAKEDRPYEGFSIKELLSPGGWKVLYGLNATSNDYLTTKVARPNDWWLHVRGAASAHVIIQTMNQPLKVQKQDLLFAAEVAIRNSPTKHSSFVSVDYTLKKYVRKPRKSAAGMASYTMEKTLQVEPGRLGSPS